MTDSRELAHRTPAERQAAWDAAVTQRAGDFEAKRWGGDTAPDTYADTAPCQRCGKDVALAHDEPCPHGLVACAECGWPSVCAQCSVTAEQEMHASGEYDARKDPFIRQTAPPYAPQRVVYLDGVVWRYRDNNDRVED